MTLQEGNGELMIVTPKQLKAGYIELVGMVAHHRIYQVVQRQVDGNYIVIAPTFNNPPGEAERNEDI